MSVRAQLAEKYDAFSWFVSTQFADGSIGHLDLTMSVRMDWHEGFHVYGEHGSVVAKSFQPWYLRSSGQLEGFAETILGGVPQAGAEDGLAAARVLTAIERSLTTGETVELTDLAAP